MVFLFGTAANPLTLAHQKIVQEILGESRMNKVVLALADHDYKKIAIPYIIREKIVRANFSKETKEGRVEVVRQDQRTFKFLESFPEKVDTVVVGEDEWKDLNEGKWHYSKELLSGWRWRVVPRTDGVSSSKVRALLEQGVGYGLLKGLVSRTTFDILKKIKQIYSN